MTLDELVMAAFDKYGFRAPQPGEDPAAYREAFITYIEQRDFAMAYELRVGRAQADWTADDVKAFRERIEAVPRGPGRDVHMIPMMGSNAGEWAPTDESMHVILDELLNMFRDWRLADPREVLFPHIAVLLMDGQLLTAPVERGERKGALRMLTRHGPCYGWAVVADAYMHLITDNNQAKKQDVILGHMGTRTTRIIKNLLYQYVNGRPVFRDEPQLWDLRDLPPGETIEDPYADLLVSVPPGGAVN